MPEPWGGYENGRIPDDAMRPVHHARNSRNQPATHHRLRADAAMALDRLLLMAPEGQRYVTDTYRDYATQVRLKREKGRYAATPGTSNHGWAMAADCAHSAANGFARWLWDHEVTARQHGWYPPSWTHDGRGIEEPWHWEYTSSLDAHRGEEPIAGDDEIMNRGDTGPHVEHVQRLLNGVNYRSARLGDFPAIDGLKVDGDYGPATASSAAHALGRATHYSGVDLLSRVDERITGAEISVLAWTAAHLWTLLLADQREADGDDG